MYIDALLDRKNDRIRLVLADGFKRAYQDVPASYVFYYEDANGSHRSIFGHPCKKVVANKSHIFRTELAKKRDAGHRIFEADINPVFRHLAEHFKGATAPMLNVGFFDIETDFNAERSPPHAPPDDPFNSVTAISLYRSADKKLLTFVLCPPTVVPETASTIAQALPDTELFFNERSMLEAFLDAIEDVSVLSGWNSSAFDVPYLVNRIQRVINRDATRRFCLWDELPLEHDYRDKFDKTIKSYKFVGRVHLDYIELFRKHNTLQRHSYSLNAIAEEEVGEIKIPYEGTLDDLYKKDFQRFIEYNRQDVMLMVKIDEKHKYIQLANQIAHENCVLLETTQGSVTLIDQAIINEMHTMGRVVPNRKPRPDDANEDLDADQDAPERTPVVGAYVAQPVIGLHEWVACADINSLYPSVIRALNMSPETLFGQVRPDETMALIQERMAKLTADKRAEAWEGIFEILEVTHMHKKDDAVLTIDFFDSLTDETHMLQMTGRELHAYVFDPANHVCITANGTLFRTDIEGMIPALLAKWYADRKVQQKLVKEFKTKADLASSPEAKADYLAQSQHYDFLQYASKIRLNSLYGALLNEYCRFGDPRMGQSTTLSGRTVVKHTNATINQTITGCYNHCGGPIIYADTDSSYFSAYESLKDDPNYADFTWTAENVIAIADLVCEETNKTFASFMQTTFHTSQERGAIIRAGRELVASRGLFIKKKKYAVLVIDKEGERLDVNGKPGKLKPIGLEMKRADTPKFMQVFLEKLLLQILTGVDQTAMYSEIRTFRDSFKARPGWEKGSPKKATNLMAFGAMLDGGITVGMGERKRAKDKPVPGHVRASLNWNKLCEMYQDRHAVRITDSARIIVCKLKSNSMGMTSIAYPMDEPHLPIWFRGLPFDHDAMEDAIIDAKLTNLVGVLQWDLSETKTTIGDEFFTF